MTIRRWIASSYYARTRNSALPLAMLFLAYAAPLCAQTRAGAAARRQEAAERADRADDRAARDLAEAGLKGERAAEKRLLLALDGPKGKARYAAIRSLGLLRSKAAAARLAGLAKSKDAGERELALEALARSGEPASSALACRAGGAAACRGLQWADDAGSLGTLREAVKSPDAGVRAAATLALARRGEREGLRDAAGAALRASEPKARIDATYALGLLAQGDPESLKLLEQAMTVEADPLARSVLNETIGKIRR